MAMLGEFVVSMGLVLGEFAIGGGGLQRWRMRCP